MSAPVEAERAQLSESLEDYLEAIYVLSRDKEYARVKDIAKARGVRTGSVISALRRLRDSGLIEYQQREYVSLTKTGEMAALRVYARHQMLSRFFQEVLRMPEALAEQDACAMEHGLSDEGLDRLVRLMEFLRVCPHSRDDFLEVFHRCSLTQDGMEQCGAECELLQPRASRARSEINAESPDGEGAMSVYDLKPGETARVTHVNARGSIRQRLLDMGVLPNATVEVLRVAPAGHPVWVRLAGSQLALRRAEARAVLVERA
jgi:DtxR family Mn-dependent transcriptional regulator